VNLTSDQTAAGLPLESGFFGIIARPVR